MLREKISPIVEGGKDKHTEYGLTDFKATHVNFHPKKLEFK